MIPTVIGAPLAAWDPWDPAGWDPWDPAGWDPWDPTVDDVLDFFVLDPHAATAKITANTAVPRKHLLTLLTIATLPGVSSFVNSGTLWCVHYVLHANGNSSDEERRTAAR